MVKVIVINGLSGSGKDEFVNYCKELFPQYVDSISTVDFIKEFALKAGWDGVRTPTSRKYLSNLKDIFVEWLDAPYKIIEKKVRSMEAEAQSYGLNPSEFFLFVHCREPKEISKIVERLSAKTLILHRPGTKIVITNHSDLEVMGYNYDYEILNNGSLKDLKDKAKLFMNALRTGTNCPYCGHHVNEDPNDMCYCPICDKEFQTMKYKEKSE